MLICYAISSEASSLKEITFDQRVKQIKYEILNQNVEIKNAKLLSINNYAQDYFQYRAVDSTWTKLFEIFYELYPNGLDKYQIYKDANGNASSKYYFEYNDKGFTTLMISQTWNGPSRRFDNVNKLERVLSSENKDSIVLEYGWNISNREWDLLKRTTYTYLTKSNNKISYLHENVIAGKWDTVMAYVYDYKFNSNNVCIGYHRMNYDTDLNRWDSLEKLVYKYDLLGRLIESNRVVYDKSINTWYNFEKIAYEYQSSDTVTAYYIYKGNSNTWEEDLYVKNIRWKYFKNSGVYFHQNILKEYEEHYWNALDSIYYPENKYVKNDIDTFGSFILYTMYFDKSVNNFDTSYYEISISDQYKNGILYERYDDAGASFYITEGNKFDYNYYQNDFWDERISSNYDVVTERYVPQNKIVNRINITTGFKNENAAQFKVYPNPTTSDFVVEFKEAKLFQIYDLTGQSILEKQIAPNQKELNISLNKSGVYILRIDSSIQKLILY